MDPANDTQTQGSLERRLHDDDTKSTVHSGKLVYAKPQDLPSFPSIGLSEKGSAASAAAALGWTTNTSPELWRPDKSAPASAAAVMAKDYKLPPPWEPVPSQHGAKAALLASQSVMGSNMSRRPTASDSGLYAANIAFRSDTSIASTSNSVSLEHRRSLLAARGAMANRQRAKSSPVPKESYPDEANAAANALSAATRAHRPVRSPTLSEVSENAGSVPFTNMNRQMFTSRPPVKPEVDEQKRADVLHASALAMAKKMFTQQQKIMEERKAHDGSTSREHVDALSSVSDDAQPAHLTNLQDAAYKQAQARLAKMHDEHFKDREFQEYYGAKQASRRFSIRGKLRKRSSSDGDVIEDRRRSQHIRQQMTLFSSKLSEVDDKKRQHDQEALLAAAQRNVHERLKGIDEKIAAETGMMPPSTLTQWEIKANATAQAESEQRMSQAHRKIDIGAGKFMEQEDIDAIAAARVKPVLDEINEKVDEEHARQTELRLEMEKKKEEEEIEKARQKEIQEISKRLKEQDKQEQKEKKAEEKQEAKARKEEDKAAKAEQKQEAKAKKEEERAAKAEHKRLARLEKQKSAADRHGSPEEPEVEMGTVTLNTAGQPVAVPAPEVDEAPIEGSEDEAIDRESTSPAEKLSRGGVKSWLKNRFSRGRKSSDEDKSKDKSTARGFIGGVALTGVGRSVSMDNRSASERAVAMAGKEREPRQRRATTNYSIQHDGMSSSSSENECFRDEAREVPRIALTPPRPIQDSSSSTNHSPNRNSKFMEMV
ncbi:uncharacterized protein GGS22DRAFT_141425 [Annulohypoxylon maeteangense]|uniref:uncharacterized protein n=1 Tax=Annulohypoxylon maeteangense TaxID=1927788 RepID=UPI002007ADE8|nr:uncharacterized protein GGS22DRAFT_141425 [Annulohypoxylon maeteangense]KAI0885261.1 hypothetical protein GGS22DRAFT_141425 [Annulohypoxylon maeteangense]